MTAIATSLTAPARLWVALAIAAIAGALTPLGEVLLPASVSAAANSSGPWAIVAFGAVYFSRARGWLAAALGVGSFVLMDLGFFVVFDSLGGYYAHSNLAFWLFVALVIGPLVGVCASWLRSRQPALQALAVAAPSSVLIGEGIFMLQRLPGVSTRYAVASVIVGFALFAILAIVRIRPMLWIAVSVAMCVAASAAFITIYGMLPLVLHKVVP